MRQKIQQLFEEVKKIEINSSKVAHESNLAANEASGGLIASYSAAGDVEHARNSANLSIQKAKAVKALLEELEKSIALGTPETIKPVCFVSVKLDTGIQKDLYFVENPIFINGFNLISENSPLGNALFGKQVDDLFLYTSGDQNFSGKVLQIE